MNDAADKHIRFGWWSLSVFVCIGITLETLHGFKSSWYLDVGNEIRRLMFTLGHAHGAALSLINIAAGLTSRALTNGQLRRSTSFCLIWATVLMPGGFFLGGFATFGGDPGLGVWLVPVGALLLLHAVGRFALDLSRK
jgi:hypothetical protein